MLNCEIVHERKRFMEKGYRFALSGMKVTVYTVAVFFTLLLFIAEAGAQTTPAASPALSELLDLGPGQWCELPNTMVNSVFPSPNKTTWAVVGAVIPAWDGATYDSKRNTATDANAANPDPQSIVKPLFDSLQPGQTVVVPPGVYKEAAAIRASNVTIKAHGVRLEHAAFEGKAALVVSGDNVTIEGLECSGIRVDDANGACIRLEARNLTLRKVFFHDSESGLLSWNRDSGTVLIEDSRFERLGRAHGVYVGRGLTHLIIRRSSFFASTAEGHEIKSRAARTTIEGSVIASLDGVDSRLIDLPDGGENLIRRNVLEEGPNSSNQDVIGVGLEPANIHQGRTTIEENIIILERRGTNVLLNELHVPASIVRRNKVIGGTRTAGDNAWFPDRKSAGIGAYPSLPEPAR